MKTLYSKIGPAILSAVLDEFYDLVFDHSTIAHLFTNDRSHIKDKQFKFLTQFLGGPQLYTEEFGHPKLRMRHLPHAIDPKAKDEWLRCMRYAIDKVIMDKQIADALYGVFPRIADHMVNR